MRTPEPSRFVYVASVAVHLVGGLALAAIEPPRVEHEIEIIEMQTVELPKPPKPEPPKPPPEVEDAPVSRPAPTPKAAPAAPPTPAAAAAPPDFGFALGNADGPGGIAVAVAAPTAPAPQVRQAAVKKLAAPQPAPEAGCAEPETKAKATAMPHPAYTEEARAAGVEGKVRVELTVDPSGAVSAARVLEGLGHGLDEAALGAVRGASFSPATRCGAPVASTFTVSVRFAL